MARKFALIVGNSQYEDPSLACLISPGSDVRSLAEVLREPEIGGFDDVTAFVDEPEVRVRRGIASLFSRKEPDDLLLLYFSTHGILDENGRLFLAARDTQRDLLKATAVSAAFITDEMDNSASRRQVLILDCCHSGAFARGAKGSPGTSVRTATAFEGNGFGRVVLTATDSTQYAWDGDRVIGENEAASSLFTRHLIEGLRSGAADEDDDGRVTLDELYEYVYRQVLSETPRQTPGKWSYKQQGNLVIAKNPNPGRRVASLPDHLQKALESDFPSTREVAVRDLERFLRGPQVGLARAAEQALEKIGSEDDSRKIQRLATEVLSGFRKSKTEGFGPAPRPAEKTGPPIDSLQGSSPSSDSVPLQPAGTSVNPEEVQPKETSQPIPRASRERGASSVGRRVQAGSPREVEEKRRRDLQNAREAQSRRRWLTLAIGTTVFLIVMAAMAIYDSNDRNSQVFTEPSPTPQTEGGQTPTPETEEVQLKAYVAEVCPHCTLVDTLKTGQLSASEVFLPQVEEKFVLSPDSKYMFAAVCGPGECDIDLYRQSIISDSELTGKFSSLKFNTSSTGKADVGIAIFSCPARTCSYTVGVWSREMVAPPAQ